MNNGNEPAMPINAEQWADPSDPSKGTYYPHGLTKREYFAGLAMQGLCSDPNMRDVDTEALVAVRMADALLAELERTK